MIARIGQIGAAIGLFVLAAVASLVLFAALAIGERGTPEDKL
jgi:hypothetical protein